jgi:hypothetical protein
MPQLSGSLILVSGSLNLNSGEIIITSGSINITEGGISVSGSPVITSNETGSFLTTGSNETIGDQTFSGSILISGSIIPNTDGVSTTSSFSLGSPTAAWKDIYVSDGTINFLDGSGNVQGTIGAGTNATVITGSLVTVPSSPLTGFAFSSTLLNKSYTSADCAFALADSNNSFFPNPQTYLFGVNTVLPWDRKITAYSLYNNILYNTFDTSNVVSLPPIFNAGYSTGDLITVYNLGKVSPTLKSSGSIYVMATVQGVTQVDTGSKSVTGTFNTAYILSGSWGNYTNVSIVNPATTESIKIDPGQKATFEVVYWGTISPLPSASLAGFPEDGYSTNFTNVSPSTTRAIYLFKGIENL